MSGTRSSMARANANGNGGPCQSCGRTDQDISVPDGDQFCRTCSLKSATADGGSGCSSPGPPVSGTVPPAPTPVQPQREIRHVAKKTGRPCKVRRQAVAPRTAVQKGKGRRAIFKKSGVRAPLAVATPVTSNHLFHKGIYYQTGDVVSMVSLEGDIYYAQLRGLLQDQYCEKSAVISWLLPTSESPPPEHGFDPATYIIGPDEELPRRLDCMTHVCSAPSDYFKRRSAPYPTSGSGRHGSTAFVFTRLGPRPVPAENAKEYWL